MTCREVPIVDMICANQKRRKLRDFKAGARASQRLVFLPFAVLSGVNTDGCSRGSPVADVAGADRKPNDQSYDHKQPG